MMGKREITIPAAQAAVVATYKLRLVADGDDWEPVHKLASVQVRMTPEVWHQLGCPESLEVVVPPSEGVSALFADPPARSSGYDLGSAQLGLSDLEGEA